MILLDAGLKKEAIEETVDAVGCTIVCYNFNWEGSC